MNDHSSLLRRSRLALLTFPLLVVLVAACGGDAKEEVTATATLQPATATSAPTATPTEVPPTETPVPEPTATPEPPPPPTPVPPTPRPAAPAGGSSAPGPGPSNPPPGPAGGGSASRTVTASLLAYSPRTIAVPANTTVTITLDNADGGVAHDLQFPRKGASNQCTGPCTVSATFNSGAPGSYPFLCSIHPTMTGTLIVQ